MTIQGWGLILAFVAVLLALAKPTGLWLFALYEGRRTPLHVVLGPVVRGFYRLSGIDPAQEQGWRQQRCKQREQGSCCRRGCDQGP